MSTEKNLSDAVDLLIDARRRIAVLERELARQKVGTVCDVDPLKGYRLQFGEDESGQPKKSPWLPHPEQGGKARSWVPLSVGQTALFVASPGDPRKGMLLRGGFGGEFDPPSQSLDENLFKYGLSTVLVQEEKTEMTVDRSFVELTPDKARIGVRMDPDSDAATEIEITQGNITAIVRGPQGQIIRIRTLL